MYEKCLALTSPHYDHVVLSVRVVPCLISLLRTPNQNALCLSQRLPGDENKTVRMNPEKT